jgi:type IV pilus biogenesis protein CpaD/CtpE
MVLNYIDFYDPLYVITTCRITTCAHTSLHFATQVPQQQRPQHPFHQFGSQQILEAALRNSTALAEIVQEVVASE